MDYKNKGQIALSVGKGVKLMSMFSLEYVEPLSHKVTFVSYLSGNFGGHLHFLFQMYNRVFSTLHTMPIRHADHEGKRLWADDSTESSQGQISGIVSGCQISYIFITSLMCPI